MRNSILILVAVIGLAAVAMVSLRTSMADEQSPRSAIGSGDSDEGARKGRHLGQVSSKAPAALARQAEVKVPELSSIVAAGSVIDDTGSSIAGIALRLEKEVTTPTKSGLIRRWVTTGPRLRTQEDGSFQFRRTVASDRIRIRAVDSQYPPAALTTTPGTTGLQFEVSRPGSIHLSCQLEDEISDEDLRCSLSLLDAPEPSVILDPAAEAGVFSKQVIAPGIYDLSISLRGIVIETLKNVHCPPGARASDDRLRNLDLRGRLHVQPVLVLGEDDTPLPNADVWLQTTSSARWFQHKTDTAGRVRIVHTDQCLEVVAWKSGFTQALSTGPFSAELTLSLRPCPETSVQVTGIVVPLNHRSLLEVTFEPIDPSEHPLSRITQHAAINGTTSNLSARLPGLGQWKMTAALVRSAGHGASTRSPIPGAQSVFTQDEWNSNFALTLDHWAVSQAYSTLTSQH